MKALEVHTFHNDLTAPIVARGSQGSLMIQDYVNTQKNLDQNPHCWMGRSGNGDVTVDMPNLGVFVFDIYLGFGVHNYAIGNRYLLVGGRR